MNQVTCNCAPASHPVLYVMCVCVWVCVCGGGGGGGVWMGGCVHIVVDMVGWLFISPYIYILDVVDIL